MKRIGVALAIALGIYGVAVGAGSVLYATGAIATGATHNDCDRGVIAKLEMEAFAPTTASLRTIARCSTIEPEPTS
jgi:hypothetical protein